MLEPTKDRRRATDRTEWTVYERRIHDAGEKAQQILLKRYEELERRIDITLKLILVSWVVVLILMIWYILGE